MASERLSTAVTRSEPPPRPPQRPRLGTYTKETDLLAVNGLRRQQTAYVKHSQIGYRRSYHRPLATGSRLFCRKPGTQNTLLMLGVKFKVGRTASDCKKKMARSILCLLVFVVGALLSIDAQPPPTPCPTPPPSPPSTITNSLINGPAYKSQFENPLPAAANDGAPLVWADLNGDGYDDLLHVTLGSKVPTGIQTFYRNGASSGFTEKTQGLNPLNGLVGIPAFADIGNLNDYTTKTRVLAT